MNLPLMRSRRLRYFCIFGTFCVCSNLGIVQASEVRGDIAQRLACIDSLDEPAEVYIIVALCDNEHQGIVPVAPQLGDGDDPQSNLYWGAQYGVRTYLENSRSWRLTSISHDPSEYVAQRLVFEHSIHNIVLTVDAYRGRYIKESLEHFFHLSTDRESCTISPLLVVYVGHNGLMDFDLASYPLPDTTGTTVDIMIFACASKAYFNEVLCHYPVYPLVWTTSLCAPEGYVLEAALEAWLERKSGDAICDAAAAAYARFQKCSVTAARKIFVSGW